MIKLVRSVNLRLAILGCFSVYDVFVNWRYILILNLILLTAGLVNHFKSDKQVDLCNS